MSDAYYEWSHKLDQLERKQKYINYYILIPYLISTILLLIFAIVAKELNHTETLTIMKKIIPIYCKLGIIPMILLLINMIVIDNHLKKL